MEDGKESIMCNVYSVFNTNQMNDMPEAKVIKERESDQVQKTARLIEDSGVTTLYDADDVAKYDLENDTLHLSPEENAMNLEYWGETLSELSKAVAHPSRQNREAAVSEASNMPTRS